MNPRPSGGAVDERLGFSHAILMQCFLPHRARAGREYIQSHGRVSIVVRAGRRADPDRPGRTVPTAVPWGSRARRRAAGRPAGRTP